MTQNGNFVKLDVDSDNDTVIEIPSPKSEDRNKDLIILKKWNICCFTTIIIVIAIIIIFIVINI